MPTGRGTLAEPSGEGYPGRMREMSWGLLLSTKRQSHPKEDQKVPEDQKASRNPFQRDVDRIVFSPGFRRLARKTQVHPLEQHDHVHTRLTHSIEVASVGRSLGEQVGRRISAILPDRIVPDDVGRIVQAACLAHDIGNPPFGHSGEAAIRAWFVSWFSNERVREQLDALRDPIQETDFTLFEGNAQGFRAITKLEDRPFEGGLRLTYATLGAFMKYPFSASSEEAAERQKCGFYSTEEEFARGVAGDLGLIEKGGGFSRHPLAYLMEAADDLCYALIDLEDAVELGLLSMTSVEPLLLRGATKDAKEQFAREFTDKSDLVRLSRLRNIAFDTLVADIVDAFVENAGDILRGAFEGSLVDVARDRTRDTVYEAKDLARRRVFVASRKTRIEVGAYSALATLLDAFAEAALDLRRATMKGANESFKTKRVLDLMRANRPKEDWNLQEMLARVMDYVSGMTDDFAARLAMELQGVLK